MLFQYNKKIAHITPQEGGKKIIGFRLSAGHPPAI
jgi:hypothetical protein